MYSGVIGNKDRSRGHQGRKSRCSTRTLQSSPNGQLSIALVPKAYGIPPAVHFNLAVVAGLNVHEHPFTRI